MLYLSQRKMSRITRSLNHGTAAAGAPAAAGGAPAAVGAGGAPAAVGAGGAGGQQILNPIIQNSHSQVTDANVEQSKFVSFKVEAKVENQINNQISNKQEEIKKYKKSIKFLLRMATFLGFCAISIGIGTNMKYGPGDMTAFESLAGKHGANGTPQNSYNSGSYTDPLRGINFGFAVAGFAFPIVGTLFSLFMALHKNNKISRLEKDINIRRTAISGFSLQKDSTEKIISDDSSVKNIIEEQQKNPSRVISLNEAIKLARIHTKVNTI